MTYQVYFICQPGETFSQKLLRIKSTETIQMNYDILRNGVSGTRNYNKVVLLRLIGHNFASFIRKNRDSKITGREITRLF